MGTSPRCSGPRTVLVVDDDPDVRDTTAQVLELAGFRVLCAENGRRALDLLGVTAPPLRPCVCVIDLQMPVMNGRELIRCIRTTSEMPLVVVSGAPDDAPAGVIALPKPVNPELLLRAVGEHCRLCSRLE